MLQYKNKHYYFVLQNENATCLAFASFIAKAQTLNEGYNHCIGGGFDLGLSCVVNLFVEQTFWFPSDSGHFLGSLPVCPQ